MDIAFRERAQPHQSGGDRNRKLAGQGCQLIGGIAQHHTTTHVQHRTAGLQQHGDRFFHLAGMSLKIRLVAANLHGFGINELCLGDLHILGEIHQHRTRSAGSGNVEGLLHNRGNILDIPYQKTVLGAGAGNADDIDFLEGIVTDQRRGDLTGYDHHGDRVHVGRGNTGDGVGGAWA